jgi:NADH-quinone oxidoreductase subunit L
MHAAYHASHSHEDVQDMRNMGGLRKYMPITFYLMWIATLAISGIPPFAGFFSKDEILGAAFSRAQGSTLADASLLGISGSIWLYLVYFLGIVAAFLTAVYMTRMMIYTFHGPNRTGDVERQHLHEAPWVMTGPLVVLGILSAFGGFLNVPELIHNFIPVGPQAALERWLDPVVGQATQTVIGTAAHENVALEEILIGVAVLIGAAGIWFAFARLKPERLVPKAQAEPEVGFERVLANKYYVDEAYEAGIVRPTYEISRGFLWRFIDAGVIDGFFVNGSAALARAFGWVGSRIQSGAVGTYAWVLVAGVIVVLGAVTLR